ncbi:putative ubiquitin-conjugating enzyme protein 17 [Daldinia childiae]|uniref:putative ubiquitin-conjugating enzyme protein 17 n=1 Tax=Daldinia childiae TaxID=326645 RepID=UPI0014489469|nr:putative ubiquitin-conjugating enzyme protein 17 [Daldinia childiae]KAF3065241.1 putative ubiquitin-conjugating enzyme protein 17 [Daldinia childiae]
MAPNLKDIKDISARISCFGRNPKDQGSIDNGKPSQVPNSTMAKPSSNSIQPKSHGPRNQPFAMFPKKDDSNLPPPPSQNPFIPGAVSTSSSKQLAQLLNPYVVAQPPASGISYHAMSLGNPSASKQSANKPNSGSPFTQINPSSSIQLQKGHGSTASHGHSGPSPSQGPGASAKKYQASISWFPQYPEGNPNLHTQPAPPIASNDPIDSLWGQPSYFSEPLPAHHMQPLPLGIHPAEPLTGHPQPLHLAAGSKQPPTLNNQSGLAYDQQMWNSYYLGQYGTAPQYFAVNDFEMFSPFLQPGQEPQDDKMEIDGVSLEDNSEDSNEDSTESTDPEQTPENTAMVETTLADLKPLGLFVLGLLNHACAGCHKKKTMGSEDVVNMTATWTSGDGKVSLGLKCQEKYCQPSDTLKVAGTSATVQWCCDDGRLAAIWALACGWKVPKSKSRAGYMITKVRGKVKIKEASVLDKLRGPHPSATGKGVGYGDTNTPHAYFFGQYTHQPKRSMPKRSMDAKEDLTREIYFRLLALLLPSCKRVAQFDTSPPSLLSHIISRSPLLENSAVMLSNGSIDEISSRSQLYDSVLDFFDALGSHPATVDLVYTDRNIYYENGGNLLEASLSPEKSKGRIVPRDTGKSLIELLGSMTAQLETLLRYAQGNPAEFLNSEGQKLLKLSQRVSEMSTRHIANMQQLQTAMDITEDKSDIDFSEWHRENCVRDVPDDAVLRNFAYAREANREPTAWPGARGRMKRLITEITTLQNSLPEGIFICHGSSRLDIMKVLIMGPRGTPYEHGLFEFDLYCPIDYPKSPPMMLFKTPNGSRTRFNPNLYQDGKICLSLLGTWPGEPWRGDESTLLQVLVSIQAMIFCEEPWYNEPGRERSIDKPKSDSYNNHVRSMTMQYAQLPWVKAINAKDETKDAVAGPGMVPVWKETARLYLRANTKDILNAIKGAGTLNTTAKALKSALKTSGYLD